MVAGDCSRRSAPCAACLRCGRRVCTAWQGPRRLLRLGRTVVTYRGCFRWSLAAFAAMAGLVTAGATAGVLLATGVAAAAATLAWAAITLRVMRLAPSCGTPGGGLGPGDAGMREPRRPKPGPPGGAIARPLPDDPPAMA